MELSSEQWIFLMVTSSWLTPSPISHYIITLQLWPLIDPFSNIRLIYHHTVMTSDWPFLKYLTTLPLYRYDLWLTPYPISDYFTTLQIWPLIDPISNIWLLYHFTVMTSDWPHIQYPTALSPYSYDIYLSRCISADKNYPY